MNTEKQIESCLRVWKEDALERMRDTAHLPDETLYTMAEKDGINNAAPEALEHLSLCPICMEKWAAWHESISMVEEDEAEADMIMSYGTHELKAAATEKPFEPVTSKSSCGRFNLGLFPQVDNPEKGLVTLDVIKTGDISYENRYVMVRDRNGRIFLKGKIHQNRLARRCENLSDIDLSKWTVMEEVQ